MRLLSFRSGLSGLLMAGALVAQPVPAQEPQEPPASLETPVPAPAPAEAPATTPPPETAPQQAPATEAAPAPPMASPSAAAPQQAPVSLVAPPVEPENVWNLDLSTGGRVSIQLRPDVAPAHVERIKTLTRQGFYNGLVFHRVIDGFMAQSGDPTATGAGGSELPDLAAEIRGLPHLRGAVGMARAQDLNSANSQFYIMFGPRLSMDRNYTVLGRVIRGMHFVDAIERGEPPMAPSRIVRASIGSDNVAEMSADELRAAAAQMAAAAPVPAASGLRRSAAAGPPVPPPPAAPRELEPARGPQAQPPR